MNNCLPEDRYPSVEEDVKRNALFVWYLLSIRT